jgi:hypothetical protein
VTTPVGFLQSITTALKRPAMRAKLADAYAAARGDVEKVARILGVSLGSARLAKKRYLDVASTGQRRKPRNGATSGHLHWRPDGTGRP